MKKINISQQQLINSPIMQMQASLMHLRTKENLTHLEREILKKVSESAARYSVVATFYTDEFKKRDVENFELVVNGDTYMMYHQDGGFISGKFVSEGVFRIMELSVFKPLRRQGLGSILLHNFIEKMNEHFDLKAVMLTAVDQHDRSTKSKANLVEFYKKNEFEVASGNTMSIIFDDSLSKSDIIDLEREYKNSIKKI